MQLPQVTLFWLRRDLRLQDNAALYQALKTNNNVLPLFIFDKNILDKLSDKADARVTFIHQTITILQQQLTKLSSTLLIKYGEPNTVWQQLLKQYTINAVYTNHDYEGYGINRDKEVEKILQQHNIALHTYKDQVIFEKNEVTKDDGKPYTVFTPYSRKWKAKLNPYYYKPYPTQDYYSNLHHTTTHSSISLAQMGFTVSNSHYPSTTLNTEVVTAYTQQRDYPAVNGTSLMGLHLRFGTVSIRQLTQQALHLNATYLSELIWRDFYHQITYHYPHINTGQSFKKEYDNIQWRSAPTEYEAWCNGLTGYPIVDAGMRQLNATGYMHNRVRMIVASFLIKHLLIDWRLGEAYFAQKLLDFDFAANNGGWQWASSSGCDAAPYFRIFNPYLQTKKFDPNLTYIKTWIPELNELSYPRPIVDHEFARNRCLKAYKDALAKK